MNKEERTVDFDLIKYHLNEISNLAKQLDIDGIAECSRLISDIEFDIESIKCGLEEIEKVRCPNPIKKRTKRSSQI